jgi:hypothetical protein
MLELRKWGGRRRREEERKEREGGKKEISLILWMLFCCLFGARELTRALHMLSTCYASELHPQLLFGYLFIYFRLGPSLEPLHQPFFVLGIFEIGSHWTICPRLASNHNPPDLCLLSSYAYRRDPLAPTICLFIYLFYFLWCWDLNSGSHAY